MPHLGESTATFEKPHAPRTLAVNKAPKKVNSIGIVLLFLINVRLKKLSLDVLNNNLLNNTLIIIEVKNLNRILVFINYKLILLKLII